MKKLLISIRKTKKSTIFSCILLTGVFYIAHGGAQSAQEQAIIAFNSGSESSDASSVSLAASTLDGDEEETVSSVSFPSSFSLDSPYFFFTKTPGTSHLPLRWLEDTPESGVGLMREKGLISQPLWQDVLKKIQSLRRKDLLTDPQQISHFTHDAEHTFREARSITPAQVAGSIASPQDTSLSRYWKYGKYMLVPSFSKKLQKEKENASYFVSEEGQRLISESEKERETITFLLDGLGAVGMLYGVNQAKKEGGWAAGAFYAYSRLGFSFFKHLLSILGKHIPRFALGVLEEMTAAVIEEKIAEQRKQELAGKGVDEKVISQKIIKAFRLIPTLKNIVISIEEQVPLHIFNTFKTLAESNIAYIQSYVSKRASANEIFKKELLQAEAGLKLMPLLGMSIESGASILMPLTFILDANADRTFLLKNPGLLEAFKQGRLNASYMSTCSSKSDASSEFIPAEYKALCAHQKNMIRSHVPQLQAIWDALPGNIFTMKERRGPDFKEMKAVIARLKPLIISTRHSNALDRIRNRLDLVGLRQYEVLFHLYSKDNVLITSLDELGADAKHKTVLTFHFMLNRIISLFESLWSLNQYWIKEGMLSTANPLAKTVKVAPLIFTSEIGSKDKKELKQGLVEASFGHCLYEVLLQLRLYLQAFIGQLSRSELHTVLEATTLSKMSNEEVGLHPLFQSSLSHNSEAPSFIKYLRQVIQALLLMEQKILANMPSLEVPLKCKEDALLHKDLKEVLSLIRKE